VVVVADAAADVVAVLVVAAVGDEAVVDEEAEEDVSGEEVTELELLSGGEEQERGGEDRFGGGDPLLRGGEPAEPRVRGGEFLLVGESDELGLLEDEGGGDEL
jgi:hypothetical protein